MKIGIVGSGSIGATLGLIWAEKGHEVFFSSRNPEKLEPLAETGGEKAHVGSIAEAVRFGEVILFSPHYRSFPEAIERAGGESAYAGKILIDATNPFQVDGGSLEPAEGETGGDLVRRALPNARNVKAINSIYYKHFGEGNSPIGEPIAAPVCGVDDEAKAVVMDLLRDLALDPVDLGGWERVYLTEPGGVFFNTPHSRQNLERELEKVARD